MGYKSPLLVPSGLRRTVHSSMWPKGWNRRLTSSSPCCLPSIPTNSFRSSGDKARNDASHPQAFFPDELEENLKRPKGPPLLWSRVAGWLFVGIICLYPGPCCSWGVAELFPIISEVRRELVLRESLAGLRYLYPGCLAQKHPPSPNPGSGKQAQGQCRGGGGTQLRMHCV